MRVSSRQSTALLAFGISLMLSLSSVSRAFMQQEERRLLVLGEQTPYIVTWDGEAVTAEAIPVPYPVRFAVPTPQPNQLLAALVAPDNPNLVLLNLDGTIAQQVTNFTADNIPLKGWHGGAVNTRGDVVVSASGYSERSGTFLYHVRPDGTFEGLTRGVVPQWSTDGHWLPYQRTDAVQCGLIDTRRTIAQVGVIDMRAEPRLEYTITSGLQGSCGTPTWVPNEVVLWYRCTNNDTNIAGVYATSLISNQTQPISVAQSGGCLRWAPNGERLLWLNTVANRPVSFEVSIWDASTDAVETFTLDEDMVPGLSLYISELASGCIEWLP